MNIAKIAGSSIGNEYPNETDNSYFFIKPLCEKSKMIYELQKFVLISFNIEKALKRKYKVCKLVSRKI